MLQPAKAIPTAFQALNPKSTSEIQRSGRSSSVIQAGGDFTANLSEGLNNVAVEENASPLLIYIQSAKVNSCSKCTINNGSLDAVGNIPFDRINILEGSSLLSGS